LKMKTIRQSILFRVSPHEVYEAMMDSKKTTTFTGERAVISREVGGKVSVFDGYVEGTNETLLPDKKIVQRWRSSDWPDGHYSTVTFELKKVPKGTKLSFTQTEVPEDDYQSKSKGWVEYYWSKMKAFLERQRGGTKGGRR
jgi:activator of HSP90 ATPase